VRAVRLLETGAELQFRARVEVHVQKHGDADVTGELMIQCPEPSGAIVDVVEIEFA
jgi:hypothetical protein